MVRERLIQLMLNDLEDKKQELTIANVLATFDIQLTEAEVNWIENAYEYIDADKTGIDYYCRICGAQVEANYECCVQSFSLIEIDKSNVDLTELTTWFNDDKFIRLLKDKYLNWTSFRTTGRCNQCKKLLSWFKKTGNYYCKDCNRIDNG